MFLGTCTHRNAMKHKTEGCLLQGQKEDTFMRSVTIYIYGDEYKMKFL